MGDLMQYRTASIWDTEGQGNSPRCKYYAGWECRGEKSYVDEVTANGMNVENLRQFNSKEQIARRSTGSPKLFPEHKTCAWIGHC